MIAAVAGLRADLELVARFDVDGAGLRESGTIALVEWLSLVWRGEVFDAKTGDRVDGGIYRRVVDRGRAAAATKWGGAPTVGDVWAAVTFIESRVGGRVRWLHEWEPVAVAIVAVREAGRVGVVPVRVAA